MAGGERPGVRSWLSGISVPADASPRVRPVTFTGVIGNPFTTLSSDPSGQWPGSSGVEYLNAITLAVGALDPSGGLPSRHLVSYASEWRPPTVAPEDRIYATYEGMTNGVQFVNDDGDLDSGDPDVPPRIDEDPLDGRDNDGDGLIDEDYDARGGKESPANSRAGT